ncbi:hypothetical protein C8Q80DRAFT_1270580 [Daedaleopsis nitida]|nr:hypothetical protein C8Q80DRAFT_1270580 [Daedaleopsis nitida]
MRRNIIEDLPLPSFTTMGQALQKDTLRLPTYRESLLARFHPYPQHRRRGPSANSLMRTVDRRYESEEVPNTSVVGQTRTIPAPDESANLERVLEEVEDKGAVKKKRSLTSLIIDLALVARLRKKRRSSNTAAKA